MAGTGLTPRVAGRPCRSGREMPRPCGLGVVSFAEGEPAPRGPASARWPTSTKRPPFGGRRFSCGSEGTRARAAPPSRWSRASPAPACSPAARRAVCGCGRNDTRTGLRRKETHASSRSTPAWRLDYAPSAGLLHLLARQHRNVTTAEASLSGSSWRGYESAAVLTSRRSRMVQVCVRIADGVSAPNAT